MADQSNEHKPLYTRGIWKAEPGKDEFYSPGEIFIEPKEDQLFRVPWFLGEGNIPDRENLLKLIHIVCQAMIKILKCERVYLVCLGESKNPKNRVHFRLLPRYREDQGILDELDSEIEDTNDGLALMARWRKQFLLKEQCTNQKPFRKLCKSHEKAIEKVRKALHKGR